MTVHFLAFIREHNSTGDFSRIKGRSSVKRIRVIDSPDYGDKNIETLVKNKQSENDDR